MRSRYLAPESVSPRYWWVFVAGGTLVFLFGLVSAIQLAVVRKPPLWHPRGIATDEDGVIYCGVGSSGIQVYDSDGAFLRRWSVPSRGGVFRIRIGSPGEVEVAPVRTKELLVYSEEGRLLRREVRPGAFREFGPEGDYEARHPAGFHYRIVDEAIVRVGPEEPAVLVPALPAPLWFFPPPIGAVAGILAGGLTITTGWALWARRRRSQPRRQWDPKPKSGVS